MVQSTRKYLGRSPGLGRALSAARKQKRLNQGDIADAVGFGRDQYIKIERGQSGTTRERLKKITEMLGMDFNEALRIIQSNHAIPEPEEKTFVSQIVPVLIAIGAKAARLEGEQQMLVLDQLRQAERQCNYFLRTENDG
jgi:transcriptional regulator with XRE-family HTH domain